ncbi:IclR family transcriptional regulator [Saccharopolyspora phatthalungensis]|uniref:DNA-binding IclR family transcriptional regulator n=1 Tax=Saccharopolyspora phatthalungensis TaxID=664693 RepID=A0A840QDW6_9PSEU|nr:IclR family transcriptional regulator [Saccharopolyspora phatthalungensis]MBB5156655.1 DNA-binding IclR family transcriptional regulator [Saccharopolyspora phatthalungensis]
MSQSLERGLTLLTALASGPQALDQLAQRLGVHKSTAMRLLRTLEAGRFVRREDVHHYRLGSTLFDLAHRALEDLDVRGVARPYLVELGETGGHTVHLATLDDDQVVYIDKVDSKHPVRMYSRIGRRAPVHCTAVGKALVAEWPVHKRRRFAGQLNYPRFTAGTIDSAERFLAELDRVRAQGYAVDRGEHEDFIHCVGAPIHNHRGEVVAAVSLSVPKVVLDFDGLLGLLDDVLRAAGKVSAELGWRRGDVNGTQPADFALKSP